MSNSATTSPRTSAGPTSKWRILRYVGWGLLSLLGLTLAVTLSIVAFGHIEGEEFSPDDFQRRTFRYYEVPLLRLQVLPIDRTSTTNALESLLKDKGYLKAGASEKASAKASEKASAKASEKAAAGTGQEPPDPRWDLVVARRSGQVFTRGDAQILCRYLDAELGDGQLDWLHWTLENQQAAQVLWPFVRRLAQQRMYIFIPEVLDAARGTADGERLRTELQSLIAGRYLELARAQQQQERHKVALELIQDGLSFDPNHELLLRAQAASRAATASSAP